MLPLLLIDPFVMQELNGLTQQLTGLQQQLQESTLEVHRLEEEAAALDHRAVQLQLELDQAQRSHSDAQQSLQVTCCLLSVLLARVHCATRHCWDAVSYQVLQHAQLRVMLGALQLHCTAAASCAGSGTASGPSRRPQLLKLYYHVIR